MIACRYASTWTLRNTAYKVVRRKIESYGSNCNGATVVVPVGAALPGFILLDKFDALFFFLQLCDEGSRAEGIV